MPNRIVLQRSDKPAGRFVRPAGFAIAALVSLGCVQSAWAATAPSEDAERVAPLTAPALNWVKVGDDRAARVLIELLESSSLDGLDPSDFPVASLQHAIDRPQFDDSDELIALNRKFDNAYVAYVRALRSGAAVGWKLVDKDLAPGRQSRSQILARAASAPSLADYIADMSFMHPAYAEMRRALQTAAEEGGQRSQALLRLNLQRLQMLPASGRYVLVNAAAQRLQMIEDGKVVDEMKVVVGKEKNPTPVMAAYIRYAALNPYWEVPSDLAAERIAPNVVKEGLGYLKHHSYVVLSDWGETPQTVDPETIDWQAVADGKILIRVRQMPGPGNAMGRMKFMFPNSEGVYLHDTPDKQLLNEDARLFSGGCVRLEDAPRLARWLFGKSLTPKGAGPDEKVELDRPVPVYIAYLTAMPEEGRIAYYEDIYGRDQAALAEQGLVGDGSKLSRLR